MEAMKKLIILLAILIILLFSTFSGCVNNSNDNNNEISDVEAQEKIIGLWQRTNWDMYQTWNFKSNGTLTLTGSDLIFNYWFENNSLYTHLPNIDYLDQYKYEFGNNNDLTLGLISNDVIIDPDTGERIDPGTIAFEITLNRMV